MSIATITRPPTTAIVADVVSGDGHPVAGIDVAVDYRYIDAPYRQAWATTDGDGRAVFVDRRPGRLVAVRVTVAGETVALDPASATAVVVEL